MENSSALYADALRASLVKESSAPFPPQSNFTFLGTNVSESVIPDTMKLTLDLLMLISAILIAFSSNARGGVSLSYTELQSLGVTCPPLDTCAEPKSDADRRGMICDCDQSCLRYGTCCPDSPFAGQKPQPRRREECSRFNDNAMTIFAVSRCNPRWRGSPAVRGMCENCRASLRDPLGMNLVTSTATNTTYKNYFCAICNDDHLHAVQWKIKVTLPPMPGVQISQDASNDLIDELEYHRSSNEWGLWREFGEQDWKFIPASLSFVAPDEVSSVVKSCNTDLVSQCSPSWQDKTVRDKCRAYMAPIIVPSPNDNGFNQQFRNAHCALCNHVTNFTNVNCDPMIVFSGPSLSLSLLLDINTSDGDKVGETKRCPDTEVYDPFYKKCRTLSCALPGYTLKSGKCVRS